MNLHLFEVALLIHAKERYFFKGRRRVVGGGGVPGKHRDCLIWLCLLVPVGFVETTLLSKFLHVEAARVDLVLWEQQTGLSARWSLSYLISLHAAK